MQLKRKASQIKKENFIYSLKNLIESKISNISKFGVTILGKKSCFWIQMIISRAFILKLFFSFKLVLMMNHISRTIE